jgi:hypothetical protein
VVIRLAHFFSYFVKLLMFVLEWPPVSKPITEAQRILATLSALLHPTSLTLPAISPSDVVIEYLATKRKKVDKEPLPFSEEKESKKKKNKVEDTTKEKVSRRLLVGIVLSRRRQILYRITRGC